MKFSILTVICLLGILLYGCRTPGITPEEPGTHAPVTEGALPPTANVSPAEEAPSSTANVSPAEKPPPSTTILPPAEKPPPSTEPATLVPVGPPAGVSGAVAKSGSATDIQSAVNSVYRDGGGVVYIPEGDFSLNGNINIRSNITLAGAGIDKTILRTRGSSTVINARGDNIRITGFSLISTDYNGGDGILIEDSIDFRVDHLRIEGYSSAGINVNGSSTRGVIDHSEIRMKPVSSLGYGVVVYGGEVWKDNMQLGTQYAVFIEDNTFINARHAVAANKGAHYVFRYNLVKQGTNGQAVDAHGPYWGSDVGTRAVEIYDNVIENPGARGDERAIGIRGGGGVIFNNTIRGYTYGVMLMMEDKQDTSSYPVLHQVHDLYIWDNSYDGVSSGVIVQYENRDGKFIQEGRDYFVYPKPGYVPYTYPHPLTREDSTPPLEKVPDN